jgi:alkylated DNA repair dioxygenase AlkB
MEIQTKESYLKFFNFTDKDLLKKCVLEVTNLLNDYPTIKIFGKTCNQRRCVGFFSNESKGYQYSNQLSTSKPMSESLLELLKKVNDIFTTNYNGILVNKYKTGNDYISAHSDDEKKLDDTEVVAISYGATRKFRIRDKKTKKIVKDFALTSYSMLQMGGKFQQEFTHEVPIEKRIKDERLSFTFRKHNE